MQKRNTQMDEKWRFGPLNVALTLNPQVRTEINKEIEAVSKAADPLKILASADTMKVLGVQRPLLQVRNIQTYAFPESRYLLAQNGKNEGFLKRPQSLIKTETEASRHWTGLCLHWHYRHCVPYLSRTKPASFAKLRFHLDVNTL